MMNSTPTESQDQKKIKPTPFKLCFVSQKEPGRSNIQIGKPLDFGKFQLYPQIRVTKGV